MKVFLSRVEYNIEDLGRDDLINLKAMLQEQSYDMQEQIAEAGRLKYETGQRADPDWFHRVKYALRKKKSEIQAIQNELGKRRRERVAKGRDKTAIQARTFERTFVDVAKEELPIEEFYRLVGIAKARQEDDDG